MPNSTSPFLAAYRNAAETPRRHVSDQPAQPPILSAVLETSQFVASPRTVDLGFRIDTNPADRELPRRDPPRPKRPLASFLHNFDSPASAPSSRPARPEPQWPEICLELLAGASPTYDQILSSLTTPAQTGTLTALLGGSEGEGTTTTALCLAIRCATHGTSTLLVDADLGNPGLADCLQVEPTGSWVSLLRSGAAVTDAIMSSRDVAVDLLLNKPGEEAPFDAWTRFHAGSAAGHLRRRYQHTFIDLGHNAPRALELATALAVDNLVLVCGPQSTLHHQEELYQQASQRHHVAAILRAA